MIRADLAKMTGDAWEEPVDFLAEFHERESICRQLIERLEGVAQSETGRLWAHHLPRMVDAIDFFRYLCQDEIDHFGEWRYHGFQPDEVLNFVDEDLDDLVADTRDESVLYLAFPQAKHNENDTVSVLFGKQPTFPIIKALERRPALACSRPEP